MNGESSEGGLGGVQWGEVFGLIGELASDIAATNLMWFLLSLLDLVKLIRN